MYLHMCCTEHIHAQPQPTKMVVDKGAPQCTPWLSAGLLNPRPWWAPPVPGLAREPSGTNHPNMRITASNASRWSAESRVPVLCTRREGLNSIKPAQGNLILTSLFLIHFYFSLTGRGGFRQPAFILDLMSILSIYTLVGPALRQRPEPTA